MSRMRTFFARIAHSRNQAQVETNVAEHALPQTMQGLLDIQHPRKSVCSPRGHLQTAPRSTVVHAACKNINASPVCRLKRDHSGSAKRLDVSLSTCKPNQKRPIESTVTCGSMHTFMYSHEERRVPWCYKGRTTYFLDGSGEEICE